MARNMAQLQTLVDPLVPGGLTSGRLGTCGRSTTLDSYAALLATADRDPLVEFEHAPEPLGPSLGPWGRGALRPREPTRVRRGRCHRTTR